MSTASIELLKPRTEAAAVTVEGAQDPAEWDGFVRAHPMHGHEHGWDWGEIIASGFGHRPHRLLARRGDRIVGVLPLIEVRSLLVGRALIATPYLNGGGLLAVDDAAEAALLDAAGATLTAASARHVELRQRLPLVTATRGWHARSHKVAMTLELDLDPGRTLSRLPSKLRSQIRRPAKAGAVARVTSGAAAQRRDIDGFYEVFAINMRGLGTPVYPRRLFAETLNRFGASARLATVWMEGACLAGGITIGAGDRTEMLWASSLRTHNALSVNMLLYAEVIRQACEDGFGTFDFGRSSPGSGTYRFKQQWGATPVPLHWYYRLQAGRPLPDLDPSSARNRWMVAAWRRMPLPMTRALGPFLARSLP